MSQELGLWGPHGGEPQDLEVGVSSPAGHRQSGRCHRQKCARSSVCLGLRKGYQEEDFRSVTQS